MSRARRLGRALASGGKATAVGAGSGVGLYYLHKLLATKVETARNHPIATPIVMGVVGHMVKKRMPTVGAAIVGAAGYAAGLAFDVSRSNPSTTQTSALVDPGNVGALLESSNVGAYEIPDAADDTGAYDELGSAATLGL